MNNQIKLLVLVCFLAASTYAQECDQHLDEARRSYYSGQFSNVIKLLDECRGQLSSNAYESDALELLAKSSLMLGNHDEARSYVENLLQVNPFFKGTNDLITFTRLLEEYEIRTRYNVGLELGANAANYTIMGYQSYAASVQEPQNYDARIGVSFGVLAEYSITRNILLGAKLLYQRHSYSQSEIQLDYLKLNVSERLNYLNIPLQVKYQINKWKIKPFVSGGVSVHMLMASSASLDLVGFGQDFPSGINPNSYSTPNYDLSGERRRFTLNYSIGGGVRKSYGRWSAQLELQYEFGLNNLSKTEARYADKNLITTYSYVSDDFKMDHFRLTFGIVKSILYPKRKTQ